MCVGPPLLIGGAGCLGQAAWLQATVGHDRTVYARSVDQWGQLERERFRYAAPAAILNTSLPDAAVGLLELSELTMEPVASRLDGGEPYLPLRYALSPTLRYNDVRYHSHRSMVSVGLELHASGGNSRDVDGHVVRAARVRVGAVSPVPLIRERHEHSTSLRCTAEKGIYDFRHNLCTKFEVLRKLCVALRPRPTHVQSIGTTEAPWSLAENAGSAGCEPPAGDRPPASSSAPIHVLNEADADDEDDENGDGTTTVGGNGWGLGVFGMGPTAGAPPPPPLAGTLYEQVYLGEFLEQTFSGEVAIVVISTAEPGFVATTLASLAERGAGALMPTSSLPVRLSFPLMMMGAAMSMPWCVCISRSREATQQEHEDSGVGREHGFHGSGSDGDLNEMDDLFADLEGGERTGERVPLLGLGLGGQASRHRRWQPPMIQQPADRSTPSSAAAVAMDPVVHQGASVSSTRREHARTMQHPTLSTSIDVGGSSSNSSLAGRLESTAFSSVDVGGADFIHFASELGVNLATEPFAHESIVSALRAPLPAPWSSHPAPADAPPGECGSVYYYNADSQESTYLHPLLQQTRFVVTRQRQEHERRLAGSAAAGKPWPAQSSATVAQQARDGTGRSKQNVGDELGQITPEKDNAASGGSVAWEARRLQLEIAAESPELGYADPWADPSGDEKDATPRAPVGNDATAGYIDSWAAQQQQGQTHSPEEYLSSEVGATAAIDTSDDTMLMPPGSHNFEARLAFLAEPEMSYAAIPPSAPMTAPTTDLHTDPEMGEGILAPPMARELEARLASLHSA
eukprot:COSAG02_NODE_671_length_18661_cov_9.755953_4_plen_800_part_00